MILVLGAACDWSMHIVTMKVFRNCHLDGKLPASERIGLDNGQFLAASADEEKKNHKLLHWVYCTSFMSILINTTVSL